MSAAPNSSASSRLDWGRSGSAFRGITRGGRGGPRGRGRNNSRGGHNGSASVDATPQPAQTKAAVVATTQPSKPAPSTKATSSLPPKPTSTTNSKDTPPHREPVASAPKPTLVGTRKDSWRGTAPGTDASAPASDAASSRPANRRRRSQSSNKAPTTTQAVSKPPQIPAAEPAQPRPPRSRTGGSRPNSIALKDAPPHLAKPATTGTGTGGSTPSVDSTTKKHDLDALVEHFRAGAMIDHHQPSTPRGRIDWADDDDTLPDLDDLGFTTTSTLATATANAAVAKNNHLSVAAAPGMDLISPIMMDGLRSLPDPGEMGHSPNAHAPHPLSEVTLPTSLTAISQKAVDQDATPIPATADKALKSPPEPAVEAQAASVTPAEATPAAKADGPIEAQKESGLEASIHAPGKASTPTSSPRTSRFSSPRPPRGGGFNSPHAHQRGGHRFSKSGSASPVHNRFSRGEGGDSPAHNRTHSTPPAGGGHRGHASRPVISGDAISRLARTIGGALPGRGKSPGVSVANGGEQ